MTDDLASGWPTQDAPMLPEEIDDPTPDPGINFDAILRRLDSTQARLVASPVPSIPALIPATPPTAWSTGSPASAAELPGEPGDLTPAGRDMSHPIAYEDDAIQEHKTVVRDSVAGFPAAQPGDFRPRTSHPDRAIPSSGTDRPTRGAGDAVTRPGARLLASPPAKPIDRMRLEPPSYDLGLGAPARPDAGPEAASPPITAGGTGSVDAAGFAGSRQGVSPEDLLKTNELLRQLVEETRRLRVAALPAASPSAYPAR